MTLLSFEYRHSTAVIAGEFSVLKHPKLREVLEKAAEAAAKEVGK